ncbi:hypothetical protein [Saccharopolyspora mangrovi]|uniref:ABC transporter permease n=1 Tax=Saccharopolyspora mangrovi TaxID=3082379 RepID=A0ABU6A2T1_9PSEU|nr:hypothetical protein [Saccharopolyspora sp. S2-29]MEB3365876.1 hypothetical protein [Saccharopolyspora sp. S2-29]
MASFLQQSPPGDADLDQILIASGSAGLLAVVLLALGYGHRTSKITALARLAERSEHSWLLRGLPGWSALPLRLALVSQLVTLVGLYWDIALRITQGRGHGPLANAAHYPILFGLFGLCVAGTLAMVLPVGEHPGRAALHLSRCWEAPTSGLLLGLAGFFSLLGFPLDAVWQRLFGQDVTLWGPARLIIIGGVSLSLVAMALLEREGRFVRTGRAETMRALYVRRGLLCGALLVGLSLFQAEWDFGVPQFRMVFQPLLIAVAAGCALVAARLWVGRGGALIAVALFLATRGCLAILVGPAVLGGPTSAMPLYVVEALCVEIAAVALVRRPLVLGVFSGLLIGTIGYSSEYLWTASAYRLPWSPDMLPEGVLMSLVGGVCGGLLGALLVRALRGELPPARVRGGVFAVALAGIAVAVVNGLVGTSPGGVRAAVAVDELTSQAEVRIEPAPIAERPTWLTITGWQGGALHVDRLTEVAPGVYRTNQPMPIHGPWKTMIRLHSGRAILATPVHFPADATRSRPGVPAPAQFTRDALPEYQLLRREAAPGVPPWLWPASSAVVVACALAYVLALGWGGQRIGRAISGPPCAERGPASSRMAADAT